MFKFILLLFLGMILNTGIAMADTTAVPLGPFQTIAAHYIACINAIPIPKEGRSNLIAFYDAATDCVNKSGAEEQIVLNNPVAVTPEPTPEPTLSPQPAPKLIVKKPSAPRKLSLAEAEHQASENYIACTIKHPGTYCEKTFGDKWMKLHEELNPNNAPVWMKRYPDEYKQYSYQGKPSRIQTYDGQNGYHTETWWYDNADGTPEEAYTFTNGKQTSHYVP